MKKLIIFTAIIVALFGALAFATSYSNKQKAEGNPYNKATLDPATIDQLDDPNYQNQILPEELTEKLDAKETVTVYFYSPTCSYCQEATPKVAPMAEKMGINLVQFNLLEFKDGWSNFNIKSTPTIVHYVNGKELKRIVGYEEVEGQSVGFIEEDEAILFEEWFTDIKNAK
ncbi:thioredoxin family protein [Bacillus timonensis]|nr:thioredoxin family protein [Bacillus timonensis]